MIFKTITNDIGKTKLSTNSSLKNFFKKESIFSDNDIRALQAYNEELNRDVTSQTAFNRTMRDASTEAQNMASAANGLTVNLSQIPKVSKASQTALKGVAIAGNMLAMMAIGEAISLTIKGIDYLVHYEEKQAEAFKKASESTKQISEDVHSLKSGMSDTASKAKELSSEYAKLVQGVNAFTNENKSLSTNNYERFLELNTQLAELFPSLTKKYDDNGNAILGLSGGVDSVAASIERLVEQQNNLAKIEIRKKLDEYIEGTDDSDGIFKSLEGCNHN